MGEWSKRVGEAGEEIVKEFFELIGWMDSLGNISIPCVNGERHKTKKDGKPRPTHGIDRLYSYKSPLEDGVLNHVIASVKYTAEPYPANPNSKFKEHFLDLTKTLECFKRSEQKQKANRNHSGVDVAKDVGVLFWLSNDVKREVDILKEVARCKGLDEYPFETVYLVDNNRVSFVYDSIKILKMAYADSTIEFFYPSTGKNINPLEKSSSGVSLPVEYINSSVLLFRVENKYNSNGRSTILIISTIERFDSSNLKRLLGLAQEISQDWAASILILFPDYNKLEHENDVLDAKSGFINKSFTSSVKVSSIHGDFRSLIDE